MNEAVFAVGTVAFSLAFTVVLMAWVARASGWNKLAAAYPLAGTFPAAKTSFGSCVFRGWFGYNGGLIVASNEQGLYLRTLPVILAFHAPIYIPWSQVRIIEPHLQGFGASYPVHTLQADEVAFALRPRTFALVRDDARRAGVPGDY